MLFELIHHSIVSHSQHAKHLIHEKHITKQRKTDVYPKYASGCSLSPVVRSITGARTARSRQRATTSPSTAELLTLWDRTAALQSQGGGTYEQHSRSHSDGTLRPPTKPMTCVDVVVRGRARRDRDPELDRDAVVLCHIEAELHHGQDRARPPIGCSLWPTALVSKSSGSAEPSACLSSRTRVVGPAST